MAELIWGNLLHLSYNMWEDRVAPEVPERGFQPYLRCDQELWDELVREMAAAGMNTLVIDLGDGVRYQSHPEIAVENAWSPAKLKDELAKIRDAGIEPLPKLNFATTHDAWMGEYQRMVSTDAYYQVCADLIAEVAELFDGPRLFHLGMDEEGYSCQRYYRYVVIRQFDLLWHDLGFLLEEVERTGARPWIWSDYLWHQPDDFLDHMPRKVLQSNWYYGELNPELNPVAAYQTLEQHHYEQVPTGSNWSRDDNFLETVRFCRAEIAPERLLGFLAAPWKPTLAEHRQHHLDAIAQVAAAKREFEAG